MKEINITDLYGQSHTIDLDNLGNQAFRMDCMELMRALPDKCFELAIVDPEYGINVANMKMGAGTSPRCSKIEHRQWKPKDWDIKPVNKSYFHELFRISINQIVWGGNYFGLPATRCFVVWDKGAGMQDRSFSECEYAWTSFSESARVKYFNPVQTDRFHPTQKPSELYAYLLSKFAHKGDRILDTHLGSGSSRIAAWQAGYNFLGTEIDADYFKAQEERYASYAAQYKLF